MSYAQLVKKWKRESKLKDKQDRINRLKQKEIELQRAEVLFFARIKEEEKQKKTYELKIKEIAQIKDNIMLELRKNNPFTYEQFLIIWDVFTHNYEQIELDIKRGKINKSDIAETFEYINNFSKNIINEYWNKKLMSIQ